MSLDSLNLNKNGALALFLYKLYGDDEDPVTFTKKNLYELLSIFEQTENIIDTLYDQRVKEFETVYRIKNVMIPLLIRDVISTKSISDFRNQIIEENGKRLLLHHFNQLNYEKFIETYSQSDGIWPYTFVQLTSLPDTNTLGVVINLHGSIVTPFQFTTTQPAVTIQKFNLSGYGSVCYSSAMTDEEVKILANHTLTQYQFSNCINKQLYVKHTFKSMLKGPKLHHPKRSCQMVVEKKKYYEKLFEKGTIAENMNHIMFVRYDGQQYVDINLLTCSEEALNLFFYKDIEQQQEQEQQSKRRKLDLIRDFIKMRDQHNYLSTSKIFDFITLAKECFGIDRANIIDLSCSVINATTGDESSYGFNVNPGSIPPDVGYGGKRTRKRKKRKRTFKKI